MSSSPELGASQLDPRPKATVDNDTDENAMTLTQSQPVSQHISGTSPPVPFQQSSNTTMISHSKIPPMDASFYQNLAPYGWHSGARHSRKLQLGMGINEQTAAAILARASDLLPSRTRLNMSFQEHKVTRDELSASLEGDAQLGCHFRHTFPEEEYPEAAAFFGEAAKHWIMVANTLKPKAPAAASIVRMASALAKSTPQTNSSTLDSSARDPDSTNLRSETRFSAQSSVQRSASQLENAATVLSSSGLAHKPESSAADLDDRKHAAFGPEALHSILKVRSSTEPRLAVAACMMDIFHTVTALRPCDICIDKVRAYWNQYRASNGLPVLPDDVIQFKYVLPEKGMLDGESNVFDDNSLRLAY
ncbi:hypothetical protein H2200_011405 [Cladophialophora chaetospira]|uniref:Uncharacterized protein n=1 Tax=Cladophialophora chaetospira TaxID=386627 RepID=A0AA38WZC5_9EURO|nr:hypothetical protein H2200_011405 [Cladophialophora chaetospira]